MIHVKAIVLGLIILSAVLGAAMLVVRYPVSLFSLWSILAAYCIGRGALDLRSGR